MYIKKLEKLVISQTGLPLLTKVQKLQSYCVNQNNFFICLSIHCSICEKIIREYNKTSNLRNNVFIIFTEDKAEIQKYLKVSILGTLKIELFMNLQMRIYY